MIKFVRIGFGALMIVLGVLMLVMAMRSEAAGVDRGTAIVAPLGLIGAGALAISASRKPPKKW